ncbi:MAG: hypothetical protein RR034_01825 [Bacteroidales bacterium]
MMNFIEEKKDNIVNLSWILLAIVAVVTLFPLIRVGFVVEDDYIYFLNSSRFFESDTSQVYAETHGRFYFLITQWVYVLPYLVQSSLYFDCMLILPILSSLILFIWLIKRICKDEKVALLMAVFVFATFQICGFHSATAAYPFYFSFSFTLLLLSMHLLVSYLKCQKYYLLIISSVIFAFVTLFYEAYLFYYLLIFIILLSQYSKNELFKKFGLLKLSKQLAPYIFFGTAYLVTYYWYYTAHPSQYSGNSLVTTFSLSKFMQIIEHMGFYALPLSSFFDYRAFLDEYSSHSNEYVYIGNMLKNAGIMAWIKGCIIIVVFAFTLKDFSIKFKYRTLLSWLAVSFAFIYIPHFLLVLSEKYYTSIQGIYVTTYFSYFAGLCFFLILFLIIHQLLSKSKIAVTVFSILFAGILLVVTVLTQYTNDRVTEDLQISQIRFELVNSFLNQDNLDNGDQLYMASLYSTPSYFGKTIVYKETPFRYQIDLYNQIQVITYNDYPEFYTKFKESEEIVKLLYFSQAAKTEDAFAALAICKGKDLQEDFTKNRYDNMKVVYYSPYKKFSMSIVSDSLGEVSVNEQTMPHQGCYHYINLDSSLKPQWTSFHLKGEKLNPNTLMFSNILFPRNDKMMLN